MLLTHDGRWGHRPREQFLLSQVGWSGDATTGTEGFTSHGLIGVQFDEKSL
jgi:hypothetical protein